MKNPKMIRTAKIIATVLKVFEYVAAVGAIVLVFALLAVAFFGNAVIEAASYTLQLDFVTLHFPQEYISQLSVGKTYAIISVVMAMLDLAISLYICKCIRRLLQPMVEGRPFDGLSSVYFKKIGWVIVFHGVVSQIGQIVANVYFTQRFRLQELLTLPYLEKVSFEFDFDFTFLLVAGMMFLLSYIFSYGQMLQKESDETL